MGNQIIAWIRILAAAGMAVALISAIYIHIKLRISRANRPMFFIARLTFFENTKEDYFFAAVVVVGVILGNIAVRL